MQCFARFRRRSSAGRATVRNPMKALGNELLLSRVCEQPRPKSTISDAHNVNRASMVLPAWRALLARVWDRSHRLCKLNHPPRANRPPNHPHRRRKLHRPHPRQRKLRRLHPRGRRRLRPKQNPLPKKRRRRGKRVRLQAQFPLAARPRKPPTHLQ